MDFDQLKNQVTNLTLYDLKAGFRKAQNAVMNYTEMEAKVREATNNEPWGSPTSVMQEIANGTFSYATLNEIMPMIYKRFTEKSAEEWRQIYKALQLLEFLIKNGSERVIDDARSHLSLLKMLRQFHYIDQNGKDQGINVRNRAKELGDLLGDVERIRSERKKAKTTRGKYGGVEGGAGLGGSSSGRYSGYGNEASGTFGGYSGGVYGDGGGFGGNTEDDYTSTQSRKDRFEEYDEHDEGTSTAAPSRRRAEPATAASTSRASRAPAAPASKPKAPEVDLFDFSAESDAPATNGKAPMPSSGDDFGGFASAAPPDDDFDDFQSATTKTTSKASAISSPALTSFMTPDTQFATPQPLAAPAQGASNLFSSQISPPPSTSNYAAFSSPPPRPQQPIQPAKSSFQPAQAKTANRQPSGPNYFGSIQAASAAPAASGAKSAVTSPAGSKAGPKADPFADLAFGGAKKSTGAASKGPSMADMAKAKSSASIWGPSATSSQQSRPATGNGNDLLGL